MAKKLGATHTINGSQEDVVERVKEITNGEMLDFVQDCAGAVPLADIAMNSIKKTGAYYITGLFHAPVPMNLGKVVRSEIDIFGTICYTREEFKECLDLIQDGRVQVTPLITHHFALKDMQQAFDTFPIPAGDQNHVASGKLYSNGQSVFSGSLVGRLKKIRNL